MVGSDRAGQLSGQLHVLVVNYRRQRLIGLRDLMELGQNACFAR